MKKLLLVLLFFYANFAFGQSDIVFNQDLPCVNKQFNIFAHVINDKYYKTATVEKINDAIDKANKLFAPICISFKLCEIDTVFNYNFRYLGESQMKVLNVSYAHHNRINLFFTHSFVTPYLEEYCLGSIDSMNYGSVFIKESFALPQALGQFFGLLHTYETKKGVELVDGSNCKSAGDEICDTPADPYVPYRELSNYVNDCIFKSTIKDINGDIYLPDVTNVMSNYFPCHCRFSFEQYKKMAENYYKASKKHW